MDLPRLETFSRYWRENPPVHIAVARYLGIKAEMPAPEPAERAGEVRDILDELLGSARM